MVIIVTMTVMITIPNGANTGQAGADRTQVGPMLATWTPPNWDSNGNLAKKRKNKSEYFKFAKIAWMAPGS